MYSVLNMAKFSVHGFVLATALILTCLGCGKSSNMAPVNGKVLLDGQPLTQGVVMTLPVSGRGAKAKIQSDGSFELGTETSADGATIGVHKVAVAAYASGARQGPESGQGKLLVPQRYTSPDESQLTIDVKAGDENNPVLELKSK